LGRNTTIAPKQRKRPITSPQHLLSCNPLLFLLQWLLLPTTLLRSSAKSFEDARCFLFEDVLGTSKERSVS
jgi:hypothetical protein